MKTINVFLLAIAAFSVTACANFENQTAQADVQEEVVIAAPLGLEQLIPESEYYTVVKTPKGVAIRSEAANTFQVGRADLLPKSSAFLDQVAAILNETVPADKEILIAGHSDNVGAKAANQRLSLRRAESVMNALSARGVATARMKAQGFGFDEPIADNRTKEGQAMNRRVDIIILDDKVSAQCRCMAFDNP